MTKEQATLEWNQWVKEKFLPISSVVVICAIGLSEASEAWWLVFPALYVYYKINKLQFLDKKEKEL